MISNYIYSHAGQRNSSKWTNAIRSLMISHVRNWNTPSTKRRVSDSIEDNHRIGISIILSPINNMRSNHSKLPDKCSTKIRQATTNHIAHHRLLRQRISSAKFPTAQRVDVCTRMRNGTNSPATTYVYIFLSHDSKREVFAGAIVWKTKVFLAKLVSQQKC